jgi:predicted Zn finger-like uncharacterized protein
MIITCPHCNFSKDIAEEDIPENASRVNCPRCGQSFPLTRPARRPGPPPIPSRQPAAVQHSAGYAGFWLRVVASLIDSLVVFVVQIVCGVLFGVTSSLVGGGLGHGPDRGLFSLVWLFTTTVGLAYYVVFTGACGQTLGKMALRIKVVRTDGSDLGYGGAFLREVPGKFLSGLILGIGYLMVAFDQRKQGLHDKIAGSLVVKL